MVLTSAAVVLLLQVVFFVRFVLHFFLFYVTKVFSDLAIFLPLYLPPFQYSLREVQSMQIWS